MNIISEQACADMDNAKVFEEIRRLHEPLGHINATAIKLMLEGNLVNGIDHKLRYIDVNTIRTAIQFCKGCKLGKFNYARPNGDGYDELKEPL